MGVARSRRGEQSNSRELLAKAGWPGSPPTLQQATELGFYGAGREAGGGLGSVAVAGVFQGFHGRNCAPFAQQTSLFGIRQKIKAAGGGGERKKEVEESQ